MDKLIKFRKATKDDIVFVIELGEMLQDESKEFESRLNFNKAEATDHYINELDNEDALIIVAEKDSRIIGYQYSFIKKLDYLETDNLECTFEAIYIERDCRSIGTAKKLESLFEDWAINVKKVNRIMADIYNGNIASENIHLKMTLFLTALNILRLPSGLVCLSF
jgi:hypothetical protein